MLPDDWKKEIVDAVDKADASNAKRQEAQTKSQNAVATPLNRIASQLVGYGRKQNKTERAKGRRDLLTVIGVWATAFFTLGAAGIFYCQLRASKEADVNSNRAWLAITSVKFTRAIDTADGPEITVLYSNVGRSPALNIKAGGTWTVMPANKPDKPEVFDFPTSALWPILDAQIRSQCSSVKPIVGGETAFPMSPADYEILAAPKPIPSLKNVINQTGEILIAPGCLTYESFGEVRHTGFCQFALRKDDKWIFMHCPAGNFAK